MKKQRTKVDAKLNPALPSSPKNPPTINVWLRGGPERDRLVIRGFRERYAARAFVECALGPHGFERAPNNWFTSNHFNFRLLGNVKGLMEEDFDVDWELPKDLKFIAKRYGGFIKDIEPSPIEESVKEVKSKSRPSQIKREGLSTISEIAEQCGMSARDARKILRSSDTSKPDTGWSWDEEGAKEIEELLNRRKK